MPSRIHHPGLQAERRGTTKTFKHTMKQYKPDHYKFMSKVKRQIGRKHPVLPGFDNLLLTDTKAPYSGSPKKPWWEKKGFRSFQDYCDSQK